MGGGVPVIAFGVKLRGGLEAREVAMIVQVGGDRWARVWALGRFWKDFGGRANKSC